MNGNVTKKAQQRGAAPGATPGFLIVGISGSARFRCRRDPTLPRRCLLDGPKAHPALIGLIGSLRVFVPIPQRLLIRRAVADGDARDESGRECDDGEDEDGFLYGVFHGRLLLTSDFEGVQKTRYALYLGGVFGVDEACRHDRRRYLPACLLPDERGQAGFGGIAVAA